MASQDKYNYTYGDYDEIAFKSRNEMNLAVWEADNRLRLYSYGHEDIFRERVGRFLHNALTEMWKRKEFLDLEVHIAGEVFKCHRTTLASVSGHMRSLLTSESQANGVSVVTLDENRVKPRFFHQLLELIYEGKDIVRDDVDQLQILKAVTYLKIPQLEWRILEVLRAKLTEKSCMQIWNWAETNNIQTLASQAKGVALTHFQVLRHTEEFLQIPVERFIMMLGHDLLKYRYEDDLLEAILDWTRFDKEDRRQHLKELLPFVCFPYLSTRYLNDLRKDELIGLRTEFAPFVDEALTYHLASLQKDGKKIQMQILRRLAHDLKRPMAGMRRVVLLIGGAVVEGESLTNVVACYLDNSHPLSRFREMIQFSIASLPYAVGLNFASAVWKHDVYVSGGSRMPEALIVYKPHENAWNFLAPLPVGRQNHAMVPLDAKLYVLGGRTTSGKSDHKLVSKISEFNTETGTWSEMGSLAVAVEGAPAVAISDKIYLLGGRDLSGRSSRAIQCVDSKTGQCRVVGELPIAVDDAKAIVLGKNIILVCPDGSIFKIYQTKRSDESMIDGDNPSALYTTQLSLPEDEMIPSDMGDLDGKFESSWSVLTTDKQQQFKREKPEELSPPLTDGSLASLKKDAERKDEPPSKETTSTVHDAEDSKKTADKRENDEGEEDKEREGETTEDDEEKEEQMEKLLQETVDECSEGTTKDEEDEAAATTDAAESKTKEEDEQLQPDREEEKERGKEDEEEDEEEEEEENETSKNSSQTQKSTASPSQVTDPKEPTPRLPAPPDVGVEKIATMEKRRDFGLFIRKVDVMVVGGQAENGNFLDDILRIHVQSGEVSKAELKLSIPLSGMQVESTTIHQSFLMQYFDATSCFYGE